MTTPGSDPLRTPTSTTGTPGTTTGPATGRPATTGGTVQFFVIPTFPSIPGTLELAQPAGIAVGGQDPVPLGEHRGGLRAVGHLRLGQETRPDPAQLLGARTGRAGRR